MKNISFIFLTLTCFSCSRYTTNPSRELATVQQHIYDETGYTVCQQHSNEECCSWLNEKLSSELSLNDAVQIALFNNQNLQATFDELGIAKANLVQAGLLHNPVFDFTYKRERLTDSARIIELTLLQNFLDILLKPLKTRMAFSELLTVQNSIAARIIDLITETKITVYTLQTNEQMLVRKNEALETAEAAYEFALQIFEAGNMNELELSKRRDAYERKKVDVTEYEMIVFSNREQLNRLLGLSGCQTQWSLSPLEEPIINCEQKMCIEQIALAKSLDLKILRQQICTTALDYGIKRSEIVFPEFTLGIDSERDPSEPWFLGPAGAVSIPIFDLGFAVRAAKHAELSRQWKAYQAMIIEIQSIARETLQQLLTSQKQYLHYSNTIVPTSERVTHESLLQVNAMQISTFDLLNAKQSEIQAKVDCIKHLQNYCKARVNLESLLIGGKTS